MRIHLHGANASTDFKVLMKSLPKKNALKPNPCLEVIDGVNSTSVRTFTAKET
jgi:hypothetical protein